MPCDGEFDVLDVVGGHAAEGAGFVQILAGDPGVEDGFAVGFGGGEEGGGVGLAEAADAVAGDGEVGGGGGWDVEKAIEGGVGEER